jgi:hypothetical protein
MSMPVAGRTAPAPSRKDPPVPVLASVPVVAKRAVLVALTAVGLVLLVLGLWFTAHLGLSGTATFTTKPASGSIAVLEPSVLNRVDEPVTVTAKAGQGTQLWAGLASPSDAAAVVGDAAHTSVTSAHVNGWSLAGKRTGTGEAQAATDADIWHATRSGTGTVRVTVHQSGAPESLVIANADGTPAALSSLTLTVQHSTWVFQSLLSALVGLLAVAAGVGGFWQLARRPTTGGGARPESHRDAEEVAA